MEDKDNYRKKLEARLDQWEARFRELDARADGISADARVAYQDCVGELKGLHSSVKSKLEELTTSGEENWEALSQSVEESLEKIDQTAKTLTERYGDKS